MMEISNIYYLKSELARIPDSAGLWLERQISHSHGGGTPVPLASTGPFVVPAFGRDLGTWWL